MNSIYSYEAVSNRKFIMNVVHFLPLYLMKEIGYLFHVRRNDKPVGLFF
jgi:hypothetical protein